MLKLRDVNLLANFVPIEEKKLLKAVAIEDFWVTLTPSTVMLAILVLLSVPRIDLRVPHNLEESDLFSSI